MIEYRSASEDDFDGIRRLLSENGWERRVEDAARFSLMLRNADRTVVALADNEVVGFARALCDDASNGYIGTVVVEREYRGRGVGEQMVRRLMGDDPKITWVLRAGRGSDGFWKKLGFRPSSAAMERTRSE